MWPPNPQAEWFLRLMDPLPPQAVSVRVANRAQKAAEYTRSTVCGYAESVTVAGFAITGLPLTDI